MELKMTKFIKDLESAKLTKKTMKKPIKKLDTSWFLNTQYNNNKTRK